MNRWKLNPKATQIIFAFDSQLGEENLYIWKTGREGQYAVVYDSAYQDEPDFFFTHDTEMIEKQYGISLEETRKTLFVRQVNEFAKTIGFTSIFDNPDKTRFDFVKAGIRVVFEYNFNSPYFYLHSDILHEDLSFAIKTGQYSFWHEKTKIQELLEKFKTKIQLCTL